MKAVALCLFAVLSVSSAARMKVREGGRSSLVSKSTDEGLPTDTDGAGSRGAVFMDTAQEPGNQVVLPAGAVLADTAGAPELAPLHKN